MWLGNKFLQMYIVQITSFAKWMNIVTEICTVHFILIFQQQSATYYHVLQPWSMQTTFFSRYWACQGYMHLCLVAPLFLHHRAGGYHQQGLSWVAENMWLLLSHWYLLVCFESSMTVLSFSVHLPVIIRLCKSATLLWLNAIVSCHYHNNFAVKYIASYRPFAIHLFRSS